MNAENKFPHSKTIGNLEKVSGVIYILVALVYLFISCVGMALDQTIPDRSFITLILFALGVFVIVAGVFADDPSARIFVLIGSVCAIPVILGIPALVLILKQRKKP
jgi:hypothetical protein